MHGNIITFFVTMRLSIMHVSTLDPGVTWVTLNEFIHTPYKFTLFLDLYVFQYFRSSLTAGKLSCFA